MSVSDEFVEFVIDLLSAWDEVSVRRMFGGAGLYCQGAMFGLIADDVAYLKADDSNRNDFLQAGSQRFHGLRPAGMEGSAGDDPGAAAGGKSQVARRC